jgi:hypothetical protein
VAGRFITIETHMNKIVAIGIASLLAMLSCVEEQDSPHVRFYECNKNNPVDTANIRTALHGQWTWRYTVCCPEASGPLKIDSESRRGLILDIDSAGFGTAIFDDTVHFSWNYIASIDTVSSVQQNRTVVAYYRLTVSPHLYYTNGYLLLCNNELMFNNSGADGEDIVFKKAQ